MKALIDFSVINSKVSTLNIIAVLLVLCSVFNSSFSTIWILVHSDRINQETLRLLFEVASQNKEVILVTVGFIARGYNDKSKSNEK